MNSLIIIFNCFILVVADTNKLPHATATNNVMQLNPHVPQKPLHALDFNGSNVNVATDAKFTLTALNQIIIVFTILALSNISITKIK